MTVGIRIRYLPVNQAWIVAYGSGDAEDTILAGPMPKEECYAWLDEQKITIVQANEEEDR